MREHRCQIHFSQEVAMSLTKKILITDATSYKAVVVAAFIKKTRPDVCVMTADTRSFSRVFHTRHSDRHVVLGKSPVADPEGYVAELERLVKENGVDVLLPINSVEVDILLRNKERFGEALAYCGDYGTFRLLNEKKNSRRFAPAPASAIPGCTSQARDALFPSWSNPVCHRPPGASDTPRRRASSHWLSRCSSGQELSTSFRSMSQGRGRAIPSSPGMAERCAAMGTDGLPNIRSPAVLVATAKAARTS